jgi:hypothetical protein
VNNSEIDDDPVASNPDPFRGVALRLRRGRAC